MNTADAASVMHAAYGELFGGDPTFRELEFALAQTHGESSWGEGWSGDCKGSNNWGALQTYPGYSGRPCNAVDSNADGKYEHGFQTWPTPVEGAKGYLKEAYKKRSGVRAAVLSGDYDGAVRELYRTGYFTGNACKRRDASGKCVEIDHETNVKRYQDLIRSRLNGPRATITRDLVAAGYKPPSSGSGGSSAGGSSSNWSAPDSGSSGVGPLVIVFGVVAVAGAAFALSSRKR